MTYLTMYAVYDYCQLQQLGKVFICVFLLGNSFLKTSSELCKFTSARLCRPAASVRHGLLDVVQHQLHFAPNPPLQPGGEARYHGDAETGSLLVPVRVTKTKKKTPLHPQMWNS